MFAREANASVAKTNREGEIIQPFAKAIIVFNTRKCESEARQPRPLFRIFCRSGRHTYLVEPLLDDFEVNKRRTAICETQTVASPNIELIEKVIVKIPPRLPSASHELDTPSCVLLQQFDVASCIDKEVFLMPHAQHKPQCVVIVLYFFAQAGNLLELQFASLPSGWNAIPIIDR
ncbi:hypothetical protein WT77_18925 [Burkholderia stagnalis]|nr:hypothetical protein WT77_18925 [Burkholderia stagnalis]